MDKPFYEYEYPLRAGCIKAKDGLHNWTLMVHGATLIDPGPPKIESPYFKCKTCDVTTSTQKMQHSYQKEKKEMKYEFCPPHTTLSVSLLHDLDPCKAELHHFAYKALQYGWGYASPISIDVVIDIAQQCKGGIFFLLEKGVIKESVPKITYSIGQRFNHVNQYRVDIYGDTVQFILMDSHGEPDGKFVRMFGTDGHPVHYGQAVKDPYKITEEEFNQITNNKAIKFNPLGLENKPRVPF
jgi:hypothetical protein